MKRRLEIPRRLSTLLRLGTCAPVSLAAVPLVACAAVFLAACATEEPAVDDGITLLEPRQQLIRLSVDLLGRHPSEAELVAIEAHPELYSQFVDRYLDDPRFLDRIEELYNERFLTRTGTTYFTPSEEGYVGNEAALADAVGDEPLKLVRYIVENDLPWSSIVTAPHSMANPALAWWWDMDAPDPSVEGWQPATYLDGRPHAGVLSMTTMWEKYPSAGVNANRHRANQLSRILLCDDFLARPVSFARSQVDALTSGDPEAVIRDNDVCQSCHSSLDPLAANFFGFWWEVEGERGDQSLYRPEDEGMWREYAGKSPAFGGVAVNGLPELGARLAGDVRLGRCATTTLLSGLTQRVLDEDLDWTEIESHREVFEKEGQNVKALVRSIANSRAYLAGEVADAATADRIPTVKTATPAQLAGIVEGITGYRWSFDGRDGLTRNDTGLVVLAGGIDSQFVTVPNHEPSVGVVLVQERLAQSAAWAVASHDLDPERTDAAILLNYVTALDHPDDAPEAFNAQIRALYLAATGVALPEIAPEVATLSALWKQLYSVDASATSAWAGIVSVVLRDPAVLFY